MSIRSNDTSSVPPVVRTRGRVWSSVQNYSESFCPSYPIYVVAFPVKLMSLVKLFIESSMNLLEPPLSLLISVHLVFRQSRFQLWDMHLDITWICYMCLIYPNELRVFSTSGQLSSYASNLYEHVDGVDMIYIFQVLKKEFPKGVDIIYESVGGDMFDLCLNALAVYGRMIVIGMISQVPSPPLLVP